MNFIQRLASNTLAPLLRSLFANYGCTITVQRPVATKENDQQTVRSYADDASVSNVTAVLMDPETATKQRVFGLVEGSVMMLVVPALASGLITINTLDRIRIESGPYAGRVYKADAQGDPGTGFATTVSLSEV